LRERLENPLQILGRNADAVVAHGQHRFVAARFERDGDAAARLSVMPKESAEKALTQNLETANEIVRIEVRKSLAKIGSEKGGDITTMPRQKRHALPVVTRSLAR